MPSTSVTKSDFRLPAPSRTSVRLAQPPACVMPKPNISPPMMAPSQPKFGVR